MRITNACVARQVEAVFLDGVLGTWSDDRLLDRFAFESGDRAERAFAAIVERHGPRVYRVCRGVTGDGPSAEDAFQATFLVLARKAATLRIGESLGPWLHGVAARLAASARTSQARRTRHEREAAHRGEPAISDSPSDHDLSRILHAEIGRLPSAYRDAVYLCDVEGLTHELVALRLSCAVGTVRSRLCRGRKRLRSRLIRRGIVPAALVTLASRATAAMPPRLADCAARNAVAITSGGASVGVVPAAAVALFEEGMTTMLKLKIRAMIGTTIIGFCATAAVVLAQDARPGAKPEGPSRKPSADSKPFAARDDARTSSEGPPSRDPLAEPPENVSRSSGADPTDPFKHQAQAPTYQDTRFDRPTEKDVREALLRLRYPDLRMRIEKVGEDADPVMVYPSIGRGQLVHVHFKATICYTEPGGPVRGKEEVIYLNRDHVRRVRDEASSEITASTAAPIRASTGRRMPNNNAPPDVDEADEEGLAPTTGRSTTSRSAAADLRPDRPENDHERATDRRLDEVERKLDRILKALEKDQTKPQSGSKPQTATPIRAPF